MKIKIFELIKRTMSFDKKIGIIKNGDDNAYCETCELATNNSVTAKTSAGIMASYIIGKGFGDINTTIINKKKMLTLKKFGDMCASTISKQRGVWVHVMWNANHKIERFNTIPFSHCRLGKKDDEDYNGKIVVYNNWDLSKDKKIKKDDFKIFDVFNPIPEVIDKQVEKAGGWSKYKGQVLFLNLDEHYDYPLATVDSVLEDCDSERQASIFKNRALRKGFFGKTIMVTKPLVGKLDNYDSAEDYAKAKSERTDFIETVEKFVGAENNGGMLSIELEHQEDKLEDAVLFKQLNTDMNDKMFEYTESSVFKNILMAFNNIPSGLVRSETALFSNSGESLQVMKETYQESTTYERTSLQEMIQMLAKYYKDDLGEIEIIPLIETKTIKEDD